MKTKKQEQLVNQFLSELSEQDRPLYYDIINHLSQNGYNPSKERSHLSFKHDLHNKQIAKLGIKNNKGHSPFLALRFSACNHYSQRLADVVAAYISKYPTRSARCIDNECSYCRGEAETHVYRHTFTDEANGTTVEKTHCGAYAIEIPVLTAGDIDEIKKLITQEHEYLLKHEAGISS